MKAILEFNLPEEQEEYDITMSAGEYHSALISLSNLFRQDRKYGEGKWVELEERFYEILSENGVKL